MESQADSIRRRRAAKAPPARDFSVKKLDGQPTLRSEHKQFLMLVGGSVGFAILCYLFVLYGRPPAPPPPPPDEPWYSTMFSSEEPPAEPS